MHITTVAIIPNAEGTAFLMGYHQRGVGKGKLNFIGGKVGDTPQHAEESPLESIKREIREEAGLMTQTLRHCADITYVFPETLAERNELMKVYWVTEYSGEIVENPEELTLTWIPVNKVPLDEMWASDAIWLPEVLSNPTKFHHMTFHHDDSGALTIQVP